MDISLNVIFKQILDLYQLRFLVLVIANQTMNQVQFVLDPLCYLHILRRRKVWKN